MLNLNYIKRNLFRFLNNTSSFIRIIGAIFILLISFFLISKSLTISTREYQDYRDNLIALQQLDSDFNQEVLKARYELFTSYDPLVRNLANQQSLKTQLINIPSFIDSTTKKELEVILEQVNSLLEQKESLSERFKSRNALLKNSLRYLPLLTNKLETKLEAPEIVEILNQTQLAALRSNLNNLIRSLLLYNITVDENIKIEIESSKAKLSQLEIEYGLTEGDFPSSLVESHTNIILNTKPQVEQLTTRLIVPLKKQTKSLEALLEKNYKLRNIITNLYRFLTICWFTILLGLLNYLLLKKIRTTNPKFRQYKRKVKRNTAALTQAVAVKENLVTPENIPDIKDLTTCREDLGLLATTVINITDKIKQEGEVSNKEESFAFLAARLKLLTKSSEKILNSNILSNLKSIFEDVLESGGCQYLDLKGEPEQIELLFCYPPNTKLSQLVEQIKTASSCYLQQEFSTLDKNIAEDKEFWSNAYFIASCDGTFLNQSDRVLITLED